MITLKKLYSALLIFVLLFAVTGVSFSRHVCISGKSVCAKTERCCKDKHSGSTRNMKCCTVQDFYLKANIVSTHQNNLHKFFPDNFITAFQNNFFVSPSQIKYAVSDLNHKPPLLQSGRSILLDSSRLTV